MLNQCHCALQDSRNNWGFFVKQRTSHLWAPFFPPPSPHIWTAKTKLARPGPTAPIAPIALSTHPWRSVALAERFHPVCP
jgi:hypothetical protein